MTDSITSRMQYEQQIPGFSHPFNVPFLKQRENYFGMDILNFNRGQLTRTILDQAPPLQTSAPYQRMIYYPMYDLTSNRPTYTVVLQWNRVSNLNPPAPKPRPY
ncbi:hypothetical protein AVEN_150373-1 [Araneus ventricosus]|uniref:Uncharacterized protein n=1 Tax=Araneus ventricosus TaxID=182803 RepID=A0A4Y2CQ54_ARAVE|nr:hypothetical protein AVEN_150373-1 [Araneus ventricosus]